VDADPELTTASSISRTQFYDHIPQLLDAFADLLCAEDSLEKKEASAEQNKTLKNTVQAMRIALRRR
jgi:hypothetical protein